MTLEEFENLVKNLPKDAELVNDNGTSVEFMSITYTEHIYWNPTVQGMYPLGVKPSKKRIVLYKL